MPDQELTTIIQTKLNRPPLPVAMVHRPRLTKWLKQRQNRPLILVTAPAGYGKSTLISCWLSSVDCPTAWVSLDEHDNQFGSFLGYFLAAIETIFPNSVPETRAFLTVTPQPSITAIGHTLINELTQIEQPFILVLDDYHLIETQTIHNLLSELLAYPPPNFHLVLGTRMDPPLPLATLRAKNQMVEVRIQDLRFTQEETQKLFQKLIGIPVDLEDIRAMDAQVEGWVTGLRLAALAYLHRIRPDTVQGKLSAQNRYVTEYLFTEILAKQAATLSDCLLKTSILDRFCADLCKAICFSETKLAGNGSSHSDFSGMRFLEWLQSSNLFVIPQDDQCEWFRYHQLFQEFLQQELARRFEPDEIVKLHITAGRWFAQNGWLEEALDHFLAAGDTTDAIELIAQHRHKLMNEARWPILDNWLNLFSDPVIEHSPELWMLKTWLAYHQGRRNELPALLERLETMLVQESNQEMAVRLAGEIRTLRSLILFHTGKIEDAVSQARAALKHVPSPVWNVRSLARLYLSGGLLMLGDQSGSLWAIYGAFEEEQVQNERYKANLLMMVSHIYWLTADLQSMQQAAEQSLALCQELNHPQILGQAQRLMGYTLYQRGNLSAAKEFFGRVVTRPYQNFGGCYANCVCGLSMTYQAQGREDEAQRVIDDAIAFLLKAGNTTQLPLIRALQAEITLQQGDLSTANQWAENLTPDLPLIPLYQFIEPHFTLVKIWLAKNTVASQEKAGVLLTRLQEYLTETHNTRYLIDTLALQAMLADATGDRVTALAMLEKSLRLAQPGGFIRVFSDLGPQMSRMLSQLQVDRELQTYVDQIQTAFPRFQESVAAKRQDQLAEPLTNRELQILELLRRRMTNKEIAAKLTISLGTVKGHTVHIYKKLGIKGRRQAVEKALELGILASP